MLRLCLGSRCAKGSRSIVLLLLGKTTFSGSDNKTQHAASLPLSRVRPVFREIWTFVILSYPEFECKNRSVENDSCQYIGLHQDLEWNSLFRLGG